MARRSKQLPITFPNGWGGARKGAGRRSTAADGRAGVPHRRRDVPSLATKGAVHVTMRFVDDIANLRTSRCMRALWFAFAKGKERDGFRLCHYAVQRNHIHLICEVDDRQALMRGMKGLSVRVARQLNKALRRSGRVIADRYHVRVLESLRQLRAAIAYVINNRRRHLYEHGGWTVRRDFVDPFSSGWYFDGFADGPRDRLPERLANVDAPVTAARAWPLQRGWRHHGLVAVDEIPARRASDRRRRRAMP